MSELILWKTFVCNWGFLVPTVQQPFRTVSCRVNRSGSPAHRGLWGLCSGREQRAIQARKAAAELSRIREHGNRGAGA